MIQGALPSQFWLFALFMATYVVNRLPTPILGWKTPYEFLFGRQLSYSSLKVFGCLCYASNVRPHKGKFEPRAEKCMFFSTGQKAYRLYGFDSNQIIVSRDVIFHEDIFPFHLTEKNIKTVLLLYLLSVMISLTMWRSPLIPRRRPSAQRDSSAKRYILTSTQCDSGTQ